MKAISLWQPWASLIACGIKPFETRDWPPPVALIGERIAVHAAKKVDPAAADMAEELLLGQYGAELAEKLAATWDKAGPVMARFRSVDMPVGCVVCTAKLDGAFRLGEGGKVVKRLISRPMPDCFTPKADAYGDYSPGRWAWLLRDVQVLNPPAPAVGRQGFFDLPQGWMVAA